ncbi:hypothetical protein CSUI_004507 [Cystoisospora suis]|uniref:Uncharacterized protein n=1 Tax=Cystoisospora suis TaxID=483139 RepID=A0A2C6KYH6_9APIC|nr:hypothetical protein CSUI_004507 [Cystoisospora suis]
MMLRVSTGERSGEEWSFRGRERRGGEEEEEEKKKSFVLCVEHERLKDLLPRPPPGLSHCEKERRGEEGGEDEQGEKKKKKDGSCGGEGEESVDRKEERKEIKRREKNEVVTPGKKDEDEDENKCGKKTCRLRFPSILGRKEIDPHAVLLFASSSSPERGGACGIGGTPRRDGKDNPHPSSHEQSATHAPSCCFHIDELSLFLTPPSSSALKHFSSSCSSLFSGSTSSSSVSYLTPREENVEGEALMKNNSPLLHPVVCSSLSKVVDESDGHVLHGKEKRKEEEEKREGARRMGRKNDGPSCSYLSFSCSGRELEERERERKEEEEISSCAGDAKEDDRGRREGEENKILLKSLESVHTRSREREEEIEERLNKEKGREKKEQVKTPSPISSSHPVTLLSSPDKRESSSSFSFTHPFFMSPCPSDIDPAALHRGERLQAREKSKDEEQFFSMPSLSSYSLFSPKNEEEMEGRDEDDVEDKERRKRRRDMGDLRRRMSFSLKPSLVKRKERRGRFLSRAHCYLEGRHLLTLLSQYFTPSSSCVEKEVFPRPNSPFSFISSSFPSSPRHLLLPPHPLLSHSQPYHQQRQVYRHLAYSSSSSCDFFHISFQQDLSKKEEQRGKGMERLSLFSPGIEEEERKKKKESRVVWFCTCANRSTKMLIYKMRKKKNERKRLDRKAKDHLIHFSLSIVSPCSFDTSAGSTSFSMISEVTLVSLSLLHRHKRDIFTRRQRRQGLVHESLHANHSSQDLPGLMKQCVQLPPLLRPTPMKEEEEESASIRREHAREFSCEEDAERIEKKIPVTPTTTLSSLSCRGENIFFSCSSSSSSSSASSTVSSQGESEEDRQKLGKEKEDEEVKEQEEEEEKPPETKEEDEEEGKERGRFQDGSTHSSSSSSSTSASAPMYILYLEPSPSSSLHAFLDHRSREVAEIYGADPAHCYPPHCSLSGFFNCSDVETVKKLLIHLFHDTNEDEGSLPDPRKEEETARLDGDRPGREEKSKEKEDREEEERKRMKKHGRDDGGRHERRREDSSCASSSASQVSQLFCLSEREKKEKRRGGEGRGEEKEDEEEMKEREAREIEMTGSSRRDGRKEDHGEERKQLARNKDRGEMKKMKKKKEKKKKDEEEVVQERRRLERGEDDVFYLGRCNEIHIERTRRGEEERLSRQKKDSELPAEKGKCQGKTSFQRDEVATSKKDMLNGIKSEKQRERNKEANLRRKENEEERGAEEKKKRDLKEVSEHHEERSCHSERSERGLQLVRNRTLYHTRVKTLQSSSILSEVHAEEEEEEKKKKDLLLVSSSLRHSYTTPATSSSYQATSLEGEGERREETREKTKKIAILEERKEQGEPEEHCPSSYLLSSCEEDKDEEEEERDSPVEIFSMDMREEARKQIQRLSRFSSLKERCEEGEPITILSSSSSFSSFPFISSFLSTEIDEETPPLGGETTGKFLPYLSSSFFPSKFYHLPSGSFSPLYLSRSSHPLQYHIPSIASSSCTSNLSNRRPCPHVNEEKGGEDGSCPFSLASPCWSTPSWDTSNLLSSSGVFQALREEKEEEERRRTTRRKENEKKVWKVHENEREIERKEEEECLMKFFSLHSSFSLDSSSSSSSSCLFSSSSHSSLHPRLGRLQQPYTRHHLSQASCLTISHFDSSSSSSVVVSSPPISASSLLILHKKKMKKIKKNKRRNSLCLCGLSSHSRCTDTATGGASSKSLLLLPSSLLSPDQLTSHTFSSSSLFFSSSSLFSSFSSGSPTRLESPPSPSKESLHTHRTSSPPPLALPSCCPSHQTLLRSSLCASSSFTREDGGVSFLRAGKEEGQGKRFLEGQEDEKNKKISFSPECVSSSLPPAFPYPYPYTCLNSLTFFSSSSLLSSHCETKGATGETHHEEAHYERSFYHDDPRLLQRNRNCIIDDGAHYRGAKQPHGRLGEREGESGSSDVGDLKKIEAKSSHRCRREKEKEQRWDLCEREEEVAEKTEERISFAVYTPYHESEGEEKNKKAWKTTEEKEKKNNEDEVEEKRKAHGMKVSQDKNARSHEREEKEEREEKKKKGGEVDGRCKEETHGLNKGGSPNSLRSYEKKKKPVYSHKSSKNSEREGEEEREEEEWKEKEEEEEEEKKKSCVISTDDGYVVLCLSTKSCLENRLTQLQEILRSVAQVHIRLKEGDHITLASQRTDKNMRESIKHFYEKFLHEREGEGLLRESTWDVVLYQLRRKARDYKTDGRHLFTEIIRFPAFLKAG